MQNRQLFLAYGSETRNLDQNSVNYQQNLVKEAKERKAIYK